MRKSTNLRTFLFWGIICVVANLFCTLSAPYDGDQSFWVGWVQSLIDGGLGNFRGNYPPLYVFWLWVVAQVHAIFGIVVAKTFLLKFLCLWPVYFAHLFLVDFSCRIVDRYNLPRWQQNLLIAVVALNPAILLGGPMWGQVDLVPVALALSSLYCIYFRRTTMLAAPLYVLSLLAKFQMILFLPVFGGLFIKNWRRSWKGLPFAIVACVLVFLPFFLGDNLGGMLRRAYIDTTSQYPFATYNAANLWMLTVGNVSPDANPFFGLSKDGPFFWFCPSYVGKALFVLFSIFTLVASIRCKSLRRVFELATWNAAAFFVLLPGMHERYILYAIPVAVIWFVLDWRKSIVWVMLLTAVASCNVSILCDGFHGGNAWTWLSAFAVLTMAGGMFYLFLPKVFAKAVTLVGSLKIPRFVPYCLLGVCLLVDGAYHVNALAPVKVKQAEGEVILSGVKFNSFRQNYKVPMMNKSVENAPLKVGGRQYKYGIGTHAPSSIVYLLPSDADSLHISAGVDDEVYDNGEVVFRIFGDEKLLWQSAPVKGSAREPVSAAVSLSGIKILRLETDPHGPDSYDHADWLSPIVKLKK